MYKKILAAVNEYSNSQVAAKYAISLAKSCQARLFLVFVAPEGFPVEQVKPAEAALEKLFIEAGKQDLEVESITKRGEPYRKIRETVTEKGVDLVFAATRREDVRKRYFIRTLARELMLKLPCSVALVRVVHPGRISPKKILVPFRGLLTNLGERACFVAKLAEGFGAHVTMFHAPKSITGFFHGEVHLPPEEWEAHIRQDMEKFLQCLEKYKIPHDKRTGQGRVGSAINIEAALRRNDLIVMGASERSLLRSVITGNPVEEVLRETPCNLIILLPRLEQS
ncbi:MAG: universal stress protein [Thermodesulfobacteriota bacterium]